MKLPDVKLSTWKGKKLAAMFKRESGNTSTLHFGAKGYEDSTTHHVTARRKRYRDRLGSATKADPNTANDLSYHLLWGESTSLQQNISKISK